MILSLFYGVVRYFTSPSSFLLIKNLLPSLFFFSHSIFFSLTYQNNKNKLINTKLPIKKTQINILEYDHILDTKHYKKTLYKL